MEAAIFSLLGLLLAFSFSGATSRFDARRQLIVQEATRSRRRINASIWHPPISLNCAICFANTSMRACKASSRSWIGLAPMSNLHALRKSNGRFGLERSPPAARIRLKT